MATPEALRATVLHALGEIAPEVPLSTLRGGDLLQEVLDLDSYDFLTFVQALHDATGIDVPEVDYPQIATLDGVVAYLGQRSPVAQQP